MALTITRPYAVQTIARTAQTKSVTGLFTDPASQKLYTQLIRVAASSLNVLVEGDTGTGKEVVARELHQHSTRADRPFFAVNCGAIPAELIESELFGHERGTFTGASEMKKGWFEVAEGGTLFLDEISELPLTSQVKLLRVLQEKEVTRLGSRQAIGIDVRLIAATNKALVSRVRSGHFREDLYFRLNVAMLKLSPLQARPGDILPLSEFFAHRYQFEHGVTSPVSYTAAAQAKLLGHSWPGNIRELENVIQYALLMTDSHEIDHHHLAFDQGIGTLHGISDQLNQTNEAFFDDYARPPESEASVLIQEGITRLLQSSPGNLLSDIERLVVTEAYRQCDGNQVHAAHLLGITRSMLRVRLKRYKMI
ncbi:MAG: sigma-54 dependent transcriptional regulator [Marinobacter sp.]|uniref:sigma-54 interaction domain-containing protein n=1 Tax=Marinobacter sp. TaxID=50741 RepID=UPI00349FFF8B